MLNPGGRVNMVLATGITRLLPFVLVLLKVIWLLELLSN